MFLEDKKWTAEEILEIIKNIDNGERWNLLEMLYDEFYNTRSNSKNKLETRIENLEKDIEYLSRKLGVHEMYFNRIHKEEEDRV